MEFKCVSCGKDFKPGSWECYPGEPHKVEEKTYYIGTGVDKVEDRAKQRVKFYYTPDIKKQDAQGNPYTEQALAAEFVRGTLRTGDPMIVLFLETKYKAQLISAEEWEKQYIHPADLLQMKTREFEQKKKAAAEENNALLEQIKKNRAELEELEAKKKGK